ncbi:MAG: DNA-binding protein [Planctomycetia bacterium]|nr:DNA-binding protein [Planctomycetia bacterium]
MGKKSVSVQKNRLPRLMTKQEVAELLRCSLRHVDTLKTLYGLPFQRLGNLVRYDSQAILKWVEQQGNY